MTDYYIYKTNPNDRWDSIATKFYGNCYEIEPIINANPHIPIKSVLDADIEIRIPIKEKFLPNQKGPVWKQ